MNTSSRYRLVGEFSRTLAFQVVRDLEHAGIRTELRSTKNENDDYAVEVADADHARAVSIV
jgi:hypothetical protein